MSLLTFCLIQIQTKHYHLSKKFFIFSLTMVRVCICLFCQDYKISANNDKMTTGQKYVLVLRMQITSSPTTCVCAWRTQHLNGFKIMSRKSYVFTLLDIMRQIYLHNKFIFGPLTQICTILSWVLKLCIH